MRVLRSEAAAWLWFLALAWLSAGVSVARAQDEGAARAEARERFDRGLSRFAENDYAGALAEFERAQALVPNEFVLFNIGLVFAALERPVESVDALESVLRAPGKLAPDRLARARDVRDAQARRIGMLQVTTNVAAAIEIDGLERGRTPLSAPLRVASGAHVVAALAQGHIPLRREVTVASGATAELALELTPTEQQLAHVEIASPLPGAEVFIDGERAGRTPLPASLAVAPGPRVIELRRAGYRSERRELALAEGARARLELVLAEDPNAASALRGQLVLLASEPEAELAVDGERRGVYRGALPLPIGPHRVRIECAGFEPAEREVSVQPRVETPLRVTLTPTPETRAAYVDGVRTRARWGVIATAGGLALAVGGAIVGGLSQADLPGLERKLEQANQDFMPDSHSDCDPSGDLGGRREQCIARISAAEDEIDARELQRTVAFAVAGAGLAIATVGVVLLLTNDDEERYEAAEPARVAGSAWLAPGGAGAGVRVRF